MPVPKRRTSKSRRDMRRANHDRITISSINPCPRCNSAKLPHRVCLKCGYYRDKPVLVIDQA